MYRSIRRQITVGLLHPLFRTHRGTLLAEATTARSAARRGAVPCAVVACLSGLSAVAPTSLIMCWLRSLPYTSCGVDCDGGLD
eukprot:COSAG02_NODE_3567_length_6548_cov_23.648007_4_plen_83_part_00